MADEDHRAVIHGSPHPQPLHQLSCPSCDLQIRIIAKICLYWVNHHQTRTEINNDLPDPFIIQCQAVMGFLINECHITAVSATAFQPWLDRIRSVILGALIDDPLGDPQCLSVRGLPAF